MNFDFICQPQVRMNPVEFPAVEQFFFSCTENKAHQSPDGSFDVVVALIELNHGCTVFIPHDPRLPELDVVSL